ncbi:hypothetical protein SY89_03046 [Halolamina pelagica]|uniref:DUF3426 domain-containing protein n=1 Tax=Halolamina pelagica TaxID=699431 RepID=A0A0P7HYF9_9EURY|nr:FxLYD domain-containing protein [Halolamina pelagica]KPN32278.1 hypothetical protein SY89_03046 [Halolamina pelagica]
MRRRALLARTALLTTAAGLAGCSGVGDSTDSPTESSTPTPTPTPSTVQTPEGAVLAVVEHELTRSNEGSEDELVAVDAVIENGSDEPTTDVRAVARFFDDDQRLLDESEARTSRLAAGGRWEVELTYPGSGADARAVADYRLVVSRDD